MECSAIPHQPGKNREGGGEGRASDRGVDEGESNDFTIIQQHPLIYRSPVHLPTACQWDSSILATCTDIIRAMGLQYLPDARATPTRPPSDDAPSTERGTQDSSFGPFAQTRPLGSYSGGPASIDQRRSIPGSLSQRSLITPSKPSRQLAFGKAASFSSSYRYEALQPSPERHLQICRRKLAEA